MSKQYDIPEQQGIVYFYEGRILVEYETGKAFLVIEGEIVDLSRILVQNMGKEVYISIEYKEVE